MNRNKLGCLGWSFVIFIILMLVSLVIEYWYIVVAIIAIAIFVNWKRIKARHSSQQSNNPEESDGTDYKTVPKTHSANIYVAKPINYDEVLDYAKSEPSIMTLENNKYINSRTNRPAFSPASIQKTRQKLFGFGQQEATFRHLVTLSNYNQFESLRQYFEVISTPFFEGAMLAYKQGDWKKAEKWWLTTLDTMPFQASRRLEIMFRKQKRYANCVQVYSKAIEFAQDYLKLTGVDLYEKLEIRKEKCGQDLLNHLNDDKSHNLVLYPSHIDEKMVEQLLK